VLLVRHAVAVHRSAWADDDRRRPLDDRGRRQAEALVAELAGYPVARILSSPADRCLATVAPLAAARGLAVETAAGLDEGAGPAALGLVRAAQTAEGGAVLCSHGDVIPEVLDRLGGPAWTAGARCQKGSTWVLAAGPGGALEAAAYLPPPA